MKNTSNTSPPSPVIKRLPRSALAFASVPLDPSSDPPSDNVAQEADSEPQAYSRKDIVNVVNQSDDTGMLADTHIPSAEQTSAVNENAYPYEDQEGDYPRMERAIMNNEPAQDVKWHDPNDWKRDIRCLVAGKNVIDAAGLLNINSALNSLEEMMQASSGQSLVLSLVRSGHERLLIV